MLAESALRSALDKVTPIKLAGKFWRVVTTSSLLRLVRGENGLPEVTRIHPHLLFAGGPRRVGGRYTPMEGPDTLYLASSERAANAEWKAGLQALFAGVELPPKVRNRGQSDPSSRPFDRRDSKSAAHQLSRFGSAVESSEQTSHVKARPCLF